MYTLLVFTIYKYIYILYIYILHHNIISVAAASSAGLSPALYIICTHRCGTLPFANVTNVKWPVFAVAIKNGRQCCEGCGQKGGPVTAPRGNSIKSEVS